MTKWTKEHRRQYQRQWRKAHPEKDREYRRREDPEKRQVRYKRWVRKHPETARCRAKAWWSKQWLWKKRAKHSNTKLI